MIFEAQYLIKIKKNEAKIVKKVAVIDIDYGIL